MVYTEVFQRFRSKYASLFIVDLDICFAHFALYIKCTNLIHCLDQDRKLIDCEIHAITHNLTNFYYVLSLQCFLANNYTLIRPNMSLWYYEPIKENYVYLNKYEEQIT